MTELIGSTIIGIILTALLTNWMAVRDRKNQAKKVLRTNLRSLRVRLTRIANEFDEPHSDFNAMRDAYEDFNHAMQSYTDTTARRFDLGNTATEEAIDTLYADLSKMQKYLRDHLHDYLGGLKNWPPDDSQGDPWSRKYARYVRQDLLVAINVILNQLGEDASTTTR